MHQHKLDDDGLASSYLMLTTIIPFASYLLYSIFRKQPSFDCRCKLCIQKKPKSKAKNFILLFALIPIISILIKNILTIKIKTAELAFDPYKVLNITVESTEAEIKKSYKKLIRAFSKKLNTNKSFAEEAIKNVNKAFEILKDPKATDNHLNNNTPTELLIALPSFILNFNTPFLIFYIVLIALAVPIFFIYKHRNFKKISATGSLYTSNERFFEEFDSLSEIPTVLLQQIFLLIGESEEFSSREWIDNIPTETVEDEDLGVPLVSKSAGYIRFILYLFRKLSSYEDKQFIATTTLKLLEAYKKIAIEKQSSKILKYLIIVEKLTLQGLPNADFCLAQYPYVSLEEALQHSNTGKNTIQDHKAILMKLLKEKEMTQSLKVLESIPLVKVENLNAFTFQTQNVEENSNLDSKNKKSVTKEGEVFLIPKDSAPNVSFDLITENYSKICHTPFTSASIPNKWYILASINDRIVSGLIILESFEGKKSIHLPLPFSSGKHTLKLQIMSNGYFGNDIQTILNIKYV